MIAVTRLGAVALVATLTALALPFAAAADEDDGRTEVRRTAQCPGSRTATLELEAKGGRIRVELEIRTGQGGSRWAVVLLHERRMVFQGSLSARSDGVVRLRRTVPDWVGADTVSARATARSGAACRVSATVR